MIVGGGVWCVHGDYYSNDDDDSLVVVVAFAVVAGVSVRWDFVEAFLYG